jgi:hypothetical protein
MMMFIGRAEKSLKREFQKEQELRRNRSDYKFGSVEVTIRREVVARRPGEICLQGFLSGIIINLQPLFFLVAYLSRLTLITLARFLLVLLAGSRVVAGNGRLTMLSMVILFTI